MKKQNFTDDELFLLCEKWEAEQKQKIQEAEEWKRSKETRDWDLENYIWEKWNPKNFK